MNRKQKAMEIVSNTEAKHGKWLAESARTVALDATESALELAEARMKIMKVRIAELKAELATKKDEKNLWIDPRISVPEDDIGVGANRDVEIQLSEAVNGSRVHTGWYNEVCGWRVYPTRGNPEYFVSLNEFLASYNARSVQITGWREINDN